MKKRIEDDDQPFLTEAEKQSALWLKLDRQFNNRLDRLRKQNDSPSDAEKTANIRGRIAEVKFFLALGEDTPSLE